MATMARADAERRRVISEHLASELTSELSASSTASGESGTPNRPCAIS